MCALCLLTSSDIHISFSVDINLLEGVNIVNRYISLTKTATLLLFFLSKAYATVWYVHPDSSLNTIQAGLNSCSDDDTVLVAASIYPERFSWPNIQGIDLISESGPEVTIIDGVYGGIVILIARPIDSTTVICGFTIQRGWYGLGGGIYCFSGAPIITDMIITNNTADHWGGGIYCVEASPIIRNSIITENTAGHWGGGICCLDNSAPVITSNIIVGNSAGYNGGGIFCDNSSATITGNTIELNIADYVGGGITCWRSSPIISNNTINRNIVGEHGGGIYCWLSSPVIDSCTISSNNSDGVYCDSLSNPIINNNNITYNIGYGICNEDSTNIIDARYNWWGDTSGPGGFGPGIGDEVSQWVDYDPWLTEPVSDIEEWKIVPLRSSDFGSTIISGPLLLPDGKECRVFDITGRVVLSDKIKPGIYFIEVDGRITRKVVKIR